MSEPFGIGGGVTNTHACGCTVTPDGFLAVPCARHLEPEPPEDLSGSEPWAEDDDDYHAPDLGTCPYYAHVRHGAPFGTCSFGCREEPECVTCEPEEGWPSRAGHGQGAGSPP